MKTKNLLLVRVLMASSGVYLRGLRKAMRAVVCALCVLATASCAYAAASLRPLGFETGDNYSAAHGVSGDGSVVVGQSSWSDKAFRWTAGSGMQSLWDVLLANGGDPAVFVSPDYASGISTVGNTIVGQGEQGGDGMSEAWVATIPATIGASPALSINSSLSTANSCSLGRRTTPASRRNVRPASALRIGRPARTRSSPQADLISSPIRYPPARNSSGSRNEMKLSRETRTAAIELQWRPQE